MNLISLTYSEVLRLIKSFAAIAIVFFSVVLLLRWKIFHSDFASAFFQATSLGLSAAVLTFGLFSRLKWRHPVLAKLLARPIIHGVWLGTLRTNYRTADGKAIGDMQIVFVIHQTFLSLSIQSFTKYQESESKLEALVQNARTDSTRLCYIYELRRQYQGENKLTTGAGELRLMERGNRLKGHYWTNSPTQGELDLTLKTRDCTSVDCFDDAEKAWLSGR